MSRTRLCTELDQRPQSFDLNVLNSPGPYEIKEYRCSHADSAVPAPVFWISDLHHLIIDGEISHITSRVGTRNLVKWNSGTFKTPKDSFKELALFWIHRSRFEVINAKEAVLEGSNNLLEEVATFGVHAAGPVYPLGTIEGVKL